MIKDSVPGASAADSQSPEVLIISPTRELTFQIYGEARKFVHDSIYRPVVVYGGVSVGHQLRQVEQGCNILVGTPGRLLDFLGRKKVSRVFFCNFFSCFLVGSRKYLTTMSWLVYLFFNFTLVSMRSHLITACVRLRSSFHIYISQFSCCNTSMEAFAEVTAAHVLLVIIHEALSGCGWEEWLPL